jgi:hypothetical protein
LEAKQKTKLVLGIETMPEEEYHDIIRDELEPEGADGADGAGTRSVIMESVERGVNRISLTPSLLGTPGWQEMGDRAQARKQGVSQNEYMEGVRAPDGADPQYDE